MWETNDAITKLQIGIRKLQSRNTILITMKFLFTQISARKELLRGNNRPRDIQCAH